MTHHLARVLLDGSGVVATVDVTDFRSVRAVIRWRRAAERRAAALRGLCLLKPMAMLGEPASGGFGGSRPGVRRQVLLGVWADDDARAAFAASDLAAGLEGGSAWSWRVTLRPIRTRGGLLGANPFAPQPGRLGPGFAALTLGRAVPRALPRFLREGTRLSDATLGAPGLVTAVTAGWPVTGNSTFSLWESEEDMVRFAYGTRPDGHARTVRAHRHNAILAEQLNARFEPLAITGSWDPATTPGAAALAGLATRLHEHVPTAEAREHLH